MRPANKPPPKSNGRHRGRCLNQLIFFVIFSIVSSTSCRLLHIKRGQCKISAAKRKEKLPTLRQSGSGKETSGIFGARLFPLTLEESQAYIRLSRRREIMLSALEKFFESTRFDDGTNRRADAMAIRRAKSRVNSDGAWRRVAHARPLLSQRADSYGAKVGRDTIEKSCLGNSVWRNARGVGRNLDRRRISLA